MKMQTASSMCSGPALGAISFFLLITMSRPRFNCHMMELAGPHQDVWPHHGPMCVICWRGSDMTQLLGQGRCVHVPVHVIPTLAVVWLCCFSLLAAKLLGNSELPGLWQRREKMRNKE